MERFSFVFLVAGIGFFALSFVVSAWFPMIPVQDMDVRTVEQLAEQPPLEFYELKEEYPQAFEKAFGGFYKQFQGTRADQEAFAEALRVGHKTYIGEACWHCHSQQVRPWGNDEARYGRVSFPEEYHNELNMPPLWGTRRIGPDLIRRGGEQSNDWHVAHFWNPPDVNPVSVMPAYPWFFQEDDPATPVDESLLPNKTGLSIILYVQWLGSWIDRPNETHFGIDSIEAAYPEPAFRTHPRDREPPPGTITPGDQPGPQPTPDADQDPFGGGGNDAANDDPFGAGSGNNGAEKDPFADDGEEDPFK